MARQKDAFWRASDGRVLGAFIFSCILGCWGRVSLEGRPCPCAGDFVCCETTNVCVESPAPRMCTSNGGTMDVAGGPADASAPGERPSPQLDASAEGETPSAQLDAAVAGERPSPDLDALVDGADGCVEARSIDAEAGADGSLSRVWLGMAPSPLSPRYRHSAVWAGDDGGQGVLVIWGGSDDAHLALDDGARYDPRADRWLPVASAGAPTPRAFASAVWTGHEVLLWGGMTSQPSDPGGAYDPVRDRWGPLAPCPFDVNAMSFAFWTGSRMLVFKGGLGASYDPKEGAWTKISNVLAPNGFRGVAVWTGSQLIVWGGEAFANAVDGAVPVPPTNEGAAYDPATDQWTPLPTDGAPSARFEANAAWTGREMIVWGGFSASSTGITDGGRYDPLLRVWKPLITTFSPAPEVGETAVFARGNLLLWGGTNQGWLVYRGLAYDPVGDEWSQLPFFGQPDPVQWHTANWTGIEMIVWGGRDYMQNLATGGRYVP